MYINMECKQSYWEDSKPSINIENNSYHGNIIQSRNSENASPPIQAMHDDVCKEENSIYQYCDRNFNFSANVAGGVTSEEDDYHHTSPKRKIAVTRDPMSHRIIEKRRRDRMNNCLADLSRLIPSEYLKKGRGRIEKTEIIEMAIKHMTFLQAQISTKSENGETKVPNGHRMEVDDPRQTNRAASQEQRNTFQEHYKYGYEECLGETLHFLVEAEGFYPSDALCVKLVNHLQEYFKKIVQGEKSVDRSPLENIIIPNSYELKVNGHPSISISEMEERGRRNSVISITRSENDSPNENLNGTSQLKEMLVGPHLNSYYTASITPNIIRHSSPERSSYSSSSNGSLFKFKNYIQERFSAERSNLNYIRYSSETSNCISLVGNKPTSSAVVRGNDHKSKYTTELDPSSTTSPSKEIKQIVNYYASDSKPVPIFALHAKGGFYVPLSVDSHLLKPFLTELNNDYDVNGFASTIGLHPVTISVNFNRPTLSKSNEFKALISPNISHHSTTTTLHMVPECR